MIEEKTLYELEVGHYVTKIAKQKSNFSLKAPKHIKNQAVINHLKSKNVLSVYIDSDKTITNKTTILTKINAGKEIFNKSKAVQQKVFSSAFRGTKIDLQPIIEITNRSVDAIFNNPDALAWMLNVRKKDEYLLEHSVAVSVYIAIFARHLDISKPIIHELSIGAFLHDVGKIKISDEILNKPTRLTDEEFIIMKTHSNHSIDIIKKIPNITKLSLEVAAQHHEKINGYGYPYQLVGDDISKYGRMIAICDIFDALVSSRVYKKGFTHTKAFSILLELANQNHLDSELVDEFIKCIGTFPVGSLVELNSKKIAIVEQRNDSDVVNPKVRSFYSVKLNHFLDSQIIDLTDTEDFIVKGVRAEDFNLDMNKIIEMLTMEG
jgi:HD-GYP domain-containing protein (c-di-GMP phosphodiesterase class II)